MDSPHTQQSQPNTARIQTPKSNPTTNFKDKNNHQSPNDDYNTKSIFINLRAHKQKGQLETAVLAKLFDRSIVLFSLLRSNINRAGRSTKDDEVIKDLVRSTTEFHNVADKAVVEIHAFTSNLRNMAKQRTRSPRATQILKNLEAIISTYVLTGLTPEYSTSSYTREIHVRGNPPSMTKEPSRNYSWRTSVRNMTRMANWVRKLNV
jgi:hypothetical protein